MDSNVTVKAQAVANDIDSAIGTWFANNITDYFSIDIFNQSVEERRPLIIDMLIHEVDLNEIVESFALNSEALLKALTEHFIRAGILKEGDFIVKSAVQYILDEFTCFILNSEIKGYTDIFGNKHSSLRSYLENPETIRELLINE